MLPPRFATSPQYYMMQFQLVTNCNQLNHPFKSFGNFWKITKLTKHHTVLAQEDVETLSSNDEPVLNENYSETSFKALNKTIN